MQALILAAGFGSRLRECSVAKPLTSICGMSLLELSVRQMKAAGVAELVVATGYQAELVEQAIPLIAEREGVAVRSVRVDDYARPNGFSVIAGAASFRGPFLLAMADHVFSGGVLPLLADQGLADADLVLAVDRRIDHPDLDKDDATWVKLDGQNRIQSIGKTLRDYDAVDCGAFLVNENLPAAIAKAIANGAAGSLSDGVQMLANAGRAKAVDIGDAWWIDVDDSRSLALARAQAPANLLEFFPHSDALAERAV